MQCTFAVIVDHFAVVRHSVETNALRKILHRLQKGGGGRTQEQPVAELIHVQWSVLEQHCTCREKGRRAVRCLQPTDRWSISMTDFVWIPLEATHAYLCEYIVCVCMYAYVDCRIVVDGEIKERMAVFCLNLRARYGYEMMDIIRRNAIIIVDTKWSRHTSVHRESVRVCSL